MKYTTINGIDFETIKSSKTQNMIAYHFKHFMRRDLYYYYEQPSELKRKIYLDWVQWHLTCDETIYDFEVTSANTFGFTIGCILIDSETLEPIGYIQITKTHNRLYLIK